MHEPESDAAPWGFFNIDNIFSNNYYGDSTQHDVKICHEQYIRDNNCAIVDNDEIFARALLQEELSQLSISESPELLSHSEECLQDSTVVPDWQNSSSNYYLCQEGDLHESDDAESLCSSPGERSCEGDDYSYTLDITDESELDGEVEKRLYQMVSVPHVPRINGDIPSVDEATSDHQRLLDRLQLYDLIEHKVQGDGNCQFRALSDQFYRTPEHHKFVRQQVVSQLKAHPEMYKGYVPMEYADYLKNMSKSGEWGDHVTLQAAADSYGVRILVVTSFKDTCYIEILPKDQKSKRVIYLSFWAEVHYNSIYPHGVVLLHEQVTPALTSLPTTSLAPYPPASVLNQDQRNESRPLCLKEDNSTYLKIVDSQLSPASSSHEGSNCDDPDQHINDIQLQLLHKPELWYLWPSLQRQGNSFPMTTESISSKSETLTGLEADHVVALARKAFSACKEAISIAEDAKPYGVDVDGSSSIRGLGSYPVRRTVRSTRHLERQTKRRRGAEQKVEVQETNNNRKRESHRKSREGYDPNDPLRLFLWGPETTQLLTAKEEAELIMKIQDLMKLQEVKNRLHCQFSREPTLVEWAAVVGISCQSLKSQIHCGNSSRERLIYANFRLVVHIAKQYQGRGLNLQDLMQEGSMGLMKSVEKFKPQVGCRFATYAYWWIRQSIRKALFQHSRTIRLPENVYGLLSKVYEAKKLCIQQGNHQPTKEDIAAFAGMSVERMEKLLYMARMPLSIQQSVWMDQDTTFQEITADPSIEAPEKGVEKQFMRQHIRNLLSVLNPRERKIIRMRFGFGIEDGKQKSLSEIGAGFGLSKERVRQLESRALYKLKQCLNSHGLAAYSDMLI